MHYVPFGKDPASGLESAGSEDDLRTVIVFCITAWSRGLHGLKTEARTRPVPEIV